MRSKQITLAHLPLLLWVAAVAQDDNWGVKVKCYMVDGTAVCPGCNSRAGLSCPRFDPDMKRRCDEVTSPIPTEKDREVSKEECDDETTQKNVEVSTKAIPDTTTIEHEISLLKNDTWRQTLKDNIDLQYFFYRMLRPYNIRHRSKREQKTTESEELIPCEWNGDCPCPLICCKAGEGCPRRCKMGIRLPPPWGK
ncbi:uncharacterized protein TNCT_346361 [Trichonephila clavata]|uniref:Secreted protein n=1 Tax=Trichonephila clavata TaxID=2740835 RepID=A0A8X6EWE1_TRICU|nr:uncharacterized protein TNCT_346361 [Trichonephila clavata]